MAGSASSRCYKRVSSFAAFCAGLYPRRRLSEQVQFLQLIMQTFCSLVINYWSSVHLVRRSVGLSTVFNVAGLLQQVTCRVGTYVRFIVTGFQSPFADVYMVFNVTHHPSGYIFEYSDGKSWIPVPAAAMRPLSCTPGASVFSNALSAPLFHSCRCPFDRQIPDQPMCRCVRPWSCRFVMFKLLHPFCGRPA
jgi:hypothetical protein